MAPLNLQSARRWLSRAAVLRPTSSLAWTELAESVLTAATVEPLPLVKLPNGHIPILPPPITAAASTARLAARLSSHIPLMAARASCLAGGADTKTVVHKIAAPVVDQSLLLDHEKSRVDENTPLKEAVRIASRCVVLQPSEPYCRLVLARSSAQLARKTNDRCNALAGAAANKALLKWPVGPFSSSVLNSARTTVAEMLHLAKAICWCSSCRLIFSFGSLDRDSEIGIQGRAGPRLQLHPENRSAPSPQIRAKYSGIPDTIGGAGAFLNVFLAETEMVPFAAKTLRQANVQGSAFEAFQLALPAALTLINSGHPMKAVSLIREKVLPTNPRHAPAFVVVSMALAHAGDRDGAHKAASRAAKYDPFLKVAQDILSSLS